MAAFFARTSKDWCALLEEFRDKGWKVGDEVTVHAPPNTVVAKLNGRKGCIDGFNNGWVIVRFQHIGRTYFRADELT